VPGRQRRCDDGESSRDRNPTSEGGDKRNGKKDGQGREEKGRQEAVSRLSRKKRGRPSPPFLLYRLLQGIPIPHAHALDRIPLLNPIDDIHPVHHLAERGIPRVEMRLR
jgi:hypothetical protein